MKTFTLRLSDEEAEALNRLSYISGLSKNKAIVAMIAGTYYDMISGEDFEKALQGEITPFFFNDLNNFPYDTYEAIGEIDERKATLILKCYDYSISHISDKYEKEKLEEEMKEMKDMLLGMI